MKPGATDFITDVRDKPFDQLPQDNLRSETLPLDVLICLTKQAKLFIFPAHFSCFCCQHLCGKRKGKKSRRRKMIKA